MANLSYIHDAAILRELCDAELALMYMNDRERLMATIADSFVEFGASGKVYNKQQTIEILEKRDAAQVNNNWSAYDFVCHKITGEQYLLMYTLRRPDNITKRVSVWEKSNNQWRILFHQGTTIRE